MGVEGLRFVITGLLSLVNSVIQGALALVFEGAGWARARGDDEGVEFFLREEPREAVEDDLTAVVESAEVGLVGDGD